MQSSRTKSEAILEAADILSHKKHIFDTPKIPNKIGLEVPTRDSYGQFFQPTYPLETRFASYDFYNLILNSLIIIIFN